MSFPPLPEPVPVTTPARWIGVAAATSPRSTTDATDTRSVRGGCWLVSYKPTSQPLVAYDGTLRVEPTGTNLRTVSGDLYQRRVTFIPGPFPPGGGRGGPTFPPRPFPPLLGFGPNPANGIPILARAQYRYYLRVTSIGTVSATGSFPLGFEMWKFTTPNTWVNEGSFSTSTVWMTAPAGYPSINDYAEGDLRSAAGAVVGRFKMGWISENYRKAVVEVDTSPGCKVPTDSGLGHSWSTVFHSLGWDVSINPDETNVTMTGIAEEGWSDAQMHEAMLAHRKAVNLDTAWYYHILSVNLIASTPRGIMYDSGATDSDNVPREGVGIANDWIVGPDAFYGSELGKKFADSKPLFFRTAVHELGHAFGLFHDTVDFGFMNTTDVIASSGTATNPFPLNIKWQYAPQGLRGLRHFPDPYVRPGGVEFGDQSFSSPSVSDSDPDNDLTYEDLTLTVTPLNREVPLGAPVRLSISLTNSGANSVLVPKDISLKSEYVSGTVTKTDGSTRSFKPLIKCVDDNPAFAELQPGESVSACLTLLRGGQGALFHSNGLFNVNVSVRWPLRSGATVVFLVASGKDTVYITPPKSAKQAAAAHKLLTTPDTQLVLVMGQAKTGHLKEGVDAIKEAVGDDVLGQHFAAIEARRLLQLGDEDRLKRALRLVDGKDFICTGTEQKKLDKLIKRAKGDDRPKLTEQKSGESESNGQYVKL